MVLLLLREAMELHRQQEVMELHRQQEVMEQHPRRVDTERQKPAVTARLRRGEGMEHRPNLPQAGMGNSRRHTNQQGRGKNEKNTHCSRRYKGQ